MWDCGLTPSIYLLKEFLWIEKLLYIKVFFFYKLIPLNNGESTFVWNIVTQLASGKMQGTCFGDLFLTKNSILPTSDNRGFTVLCFLCSQFFSQKNTYVLFDLFQGKTSVYGRKMYTNLRVFISLELLVDTYRWKIKN